MSDDPATTIGAALADIDAHLRKISERQAEIVQALQDQTGCMHRNRADLTTMGEGRTFMCNDCGEVVHVDE